MAEEEDTLICDECGTEFPLHRYSDGPCPKCERYYAYDETQMPFLSGDDWDAIAAAKAARCSP